MNTDPHKRFWVSLYRNVLHVDSSCYTRVWFFMAYFKKRLISQLAVSLKSLFMGFWGLDCRDVDVKTIFYENFAEN